MFGIRKVSTEHKPQAKAVTGNQWLLGAALNISDSSVSLNRSDHNISDILTDYESISDILVDYR